MRKRFRITAIVGESSRGRLGRRVYLRGSTGRIGRDQTHSENVVKDRDMNKVPNGPSEGPYIMHGTFTKILEETTTGVSH